MNPESSGTSQDRKSYNLKSDYRTKLNPRKKTKDTQNYKPKYSLDVVSGNSLSLSSSIDSITTRKSGSENSKNTIRKIHDERRSRLSNSDEILHKFVAENSDRHNSLASSDTVEEEDFNEQLEKLPSKMWWVPPLKTPSNYKPPSISMSSKSYSIVSSVSRPRIIRSAEDLRKKVISQCNFMEAVGYDKSNKHKEKLEEKATANIEYVSSNELFWVPSLNLKSSNQTESTTPATVQSASPKRSSSKTSLPQNLTIILHKQADHGCNNLSHFISESEIKGSDSNFATRGTFSSSGGDQDFTKKTYSNQSVQYEDVSSLQKEPYFTVGDIAREHIVNPITLKLARLCTQQGQLYVDVIDDLEKSCKEFENACKNRVVQKKL